jgi:hypothetical protein
MKAKIRKTGEIVEVYHESQHGQTTNIYKEAVFLNGRMWTEDELELLTNNEEDEHWNDVRERAAIAAMQGTISILSDSNEIPNEIPKEIAEFSVACANALVEELKML